MYPSSQSLQTRKKPTVVHVVIRAQLRAAVVVEVHLKVNVAALSLDLQREQFDLVCTDLHVFVR
jgi:hypothetical protein